MNVGSILNNDYPPSDNEQGSNANANKKTPSPPLNNDNVDSTLPTQAQAQPPILSPVITNINQQPQLNSSNSNSPVENSSKQSIHQRHSINNLLNDSTISSNSIPEQTSQILQPQSSQPTKFNTNIHNSSSSMKSPTSISPTTNNHNQIQNQNNNKIISPKQIVKPTLSQRNSIADITNDKDFDIDTGKETSSNISRKSSEIIENDKEEENEKKVKKENEIKEQEKGDEKENEIENDSNLNSKTSTNNESNNINNQIQNKNKNKNNNKYKKKPKRYSTPPIWAQDYYGNNGPNLHNGSINGDHLPPDNEPKSHLTDKNIFNRDKTSSVDLECSITNTIPPSSVVRTITEWIYANFIEIPILNRKFVELELKFGTIIDKVAGRRLDINVSTECIYNNTSSIHFDSGVHEVGWNDMKSFFDELERQYQDELKKQSQSTNTKPKRKFSNFETDITDEFFQIVQRGETPKSIRISKDNTLNPPRYLAINKQRISDLYIHNPSSMYDLRLSLSFEHPIPENSIEPILKNNKPNLTRIKKRNSIDHRSTVTQFDFTRVLVPKEIKTKSGKLSVEYDQNFEAELEIDTIELFNGFDKFKEGNDNIRFEELVEIFMNNARILNNRVTRLASGR